ncbi:MAG: ribulose 1,5-bisphosphate carboxylase [Balneolaceae bacterium]|nr:MAG: ribulose 1,5-bisphosphate carboxylase [Balneolaceae bacterium]
MDGDRFTVTYILSAESEKEVNSRAESIRVEQTVEMPLSAVPAPGLHSLGRIESIRKTEENCRWRVVISYPNQLSFNDITQGINVLFGNISLLPGILITDCSDSFFKPLFSGPAHGIRGIRELLDNPNGGISCTALKPVGLSPQELAERALHFAASGIDLIKDDHGLTNQNSAPFTDRVRQCVYAVRAGEQKSGKRTLYFPNITSSPEKVLENAIFARENGADGLLLCPQLCGLELIRTISSEIGLPVMAHPAFSGSMVIHPDHGFTPEFYYGKLWRALGADCVIYPNAGGRFSFSEETCQRINTQLRTPFCGFQSSLPAPAGGISLESIPKLLQQYGPDTAYLIGGSLYANNLGFAEAAKQFNQTLQ